MQPRQHQPYPVLCTATHNQGNPMQNLELMIPITLFVCITYAIKAVVDARVRKQLVASNVSQELIQSIVEADELRRRHATLRWGVVDFETELVPFTRQNADIFLGCHRQSDPSCTYLEAMGCGVAVAT